ncbi:molybdate ABC transporter substrate-binding protein [soil metagenome]
MKRIIALGLLLAVGLGSAQKITVFAASSLTEAFEEMAQTFEASHEGVNVVLNFAGSSTLSTQIVQGAPADVFASADWKQMEVVAAEGLIVDEPIDFAGNKLVVITPKDSAVASLEDLASPGVKVVLAAPEVPVGAYARAALENLNAVYGPDFKTRVEANLVSEEPNVRQAAAKVELGEADAVIVYATDAAVLSNVRTVQIPDNINVLASYPIAVLKDAPQSDLAGRFVAFVLSDAGQAILMKYGFTRTP